MPGFDVLQRDLPLKTKCFLEASAGTGKTFAIEHLVTRLLLADEGPKIDEILIVTFTKAATLELKERIRKKIEEVESSLRNGICLYPYLEPIFEKNEAKLASRRLKRSLAFFEEAKIFTIHSFCFHSLQNNPVEGNFSFETEEKNSSSELFVQDHLLTFESLHPKQWEILIQAHKGDFKSILASVSKLIEKRLPIECGKDFSEIEATFFQELKACNMTSSEVLEQLLLAAPSYEKMCTRQKELKREVKEGLKKFSELFEKKREFPFQTPLLNMKKENQLKSAKLPPPQLWENIDRKLLPLIEEANDYQKILALVAESARKKIEDRYFYEDLLIDMKTKISDPDFATSLRNSYKAVFIDEFQDTDRLQWEIFSTVFCHEEYEGTLYLIGDPKQSIYRFRHADLYTYMEARKKIQEQKSLLINFRSQEGLVAALNALFKEIPDFLYLPKTKEKEKCPPIVPSTTRGKKTWQDGLGSLHFFSGEKEEELFAFTIHEIKRLHLKEKIPLHQFAVLVKDRIQAEAFIKLAKKKELPVIAKKNKMLDESRAFDVLHDLIEASLDPKDKNLRFKVLAGPLFYLHEEEFEKNGMVEKFSKLGKIYMEKGVFALLAQVIDPQKISSFEGGAELYQELMQIAELFAQGTSSLSQLKESAKSIAIHSLQEQEAVQVLTIHISKGLEYDVVFPLGLIKNTTPKKEIVLDQDLGVLTSRKETFEAHLQELEAEKTRLLYVACTRARERLYFPLLKKEKPIKDHPEISFSTCEYSEIEAWRPWEKLQVEEKQTSSPPFFSPQCIHSFSSLAQPKKQIKKALEMPAGPEFGRFIHRIMETFPFQDLEAMVEKSDYSPWKEEILTMVSNALHCPLLHFSLIDLDPAKMMKEVEFLYEDGTGNHLKGFIDLMFEHEGKVYFLDYKSNVLVNTIEEEMEAGDYFLQARIYSIAVKKYLNLFNPKPNYGGAFYLFLRAPLVYHIQP